MSGAVTSLFTLFRGNFDNLAFLTARIKLEGNYNKTSCRKKVIRCQLSVCINRIHGDCCVLCYPEFTTTVGETGMFDETIYNK